jgi:hypothetical protein
MIPPINLKELQISIGKIQSLTVNEDTRIPLLYKNILYRRGTRNKKRIMTGVSSGYKKNFMITFYITA